MASDSLYLTEKLLPSVRLNTTRPLSLSAAMFLNMLPVISFARTPVLSPLTVQ
jgi:hypothetical protein